MKCENSPDGQWRCIVSQSGKSYMTAHYFIDDKSLCGIKNDYTLREKHYICCKKCARIYATHRKEVE